MTWYSVFHNDSKQGFFFCPIHSLQDCLNQGQEETRKLLPFPIMPLSHWEKREREKAQK